MCLIAFHWQPETETPLVVLANRDEQHARPTAPLAYWEDAPQVLAGRDLQAGGTWMGLSRSGRFAALTNIREPGVKPGPRSRGELVANYLRAPGDCADVLAYAQQLGGEIAEYSGFNVLLGSRRELVYLSNRDAESPRLVSPGTHGLSNALLDTPWPKLQTVTQGLAAALKGGKASDELLKIMLRREGYDDENLPKTGVGLNLERLLAPPFICSPGYGTRATSYLSLGQSSAQLIERRYGSDGSLQGETEQQLNFADS